MVTGDWNSRPSEGQSMHLPTEDLTSPPEVCFLYTILSVTLIQTKSQRFSTTAFTFGLQGDTGSKLDFFFSSYPPGNPLRSSGDLLRQENVFESLQDLGELSPNLNFLEQMALSLKHGLVS